MSEDDPTADAMVLAEDLRRAVGTFVRAIRERADTEKSAQSETLALLAREGAMNVAALANRRNVTHQTMRVVVAQLAADGLVERGPDPADRRSQLLSVSDAGRREIARDRLARASRIAALIEASLPPSERRRLHDATVLLDRLSAAAGD